MYKTCTVCGGIHLFESNRCRKNAYNTGLDYSRKDTGYAFRQKGKYHNLAKIVREDSKNLCAVCLDEGIYNSRRVEVHHIEPIKNRPDLAYDYDNLVCLCKWHHEYAEKGLISKDYLKKLPPRGKTGSL